MACLGEGIFVRWFLLCDGLVFSIAGYLVPSSNQHLCERQLHDCLFVITFTVLNFSHDFVHSFFLIMLLICFLGSLSPACDQKYEAAVSDHCTPSPPNLSLEIHLFLVVVLLLPTPLAVIQSTTKRNKIKTRIT